MGNTVSFSYTHGSPKFTIKFTINKKTKDCSINLTSGSHHYEYPLDIRIKSGSDTVCHIGMPKFSMNFKPVNESASGTAKGSSVKLQVRCGDQYCASSWRGDDDGYVTKKTYRFPSAKKTTTDRYDNNPSCTIHAVDNTTSVVYLRIDTKVAATVTPVTTTTVNGTTTTTYGTPYTATGAEFYITGSPIKLSDLDDGYSVDCSDGSDDPDFLAGVPQANVRNLPYPGTGHCFQVWYCDDYSDFRCICEYWYPTARAPVVVASAGTTAISFSISLPPWGHDATKYNDGMMEAYRTVISDSESVPDYITGVSGYTAATYHNYKGSTKYYVHTVRLDSAGRIDFDSHVCVAVTTGYVVIKSITAVEHHTDSVKLSLELGGMSSDGQHISVSTNNTDLYYSTDLKWVDYQPVATWNYLATTPASTAVVSIPMNPHEVKTICFMYRELNDARNTVLTDFITPYYTTIASNVNVVKVGNNWAIPKVYTNAGWKYTKAKVFVGSTWHDTREAHYNYTTKRWEV